VASTRDYVKAIAEFVWNALDADAKRTSVEFVRNGLGGLENIIIRDNGSGITKARAEHDFESLGESWKLTKARTPLLGRAIHGKEGQGRLRFFRPKGLALTARGSQTPTSKNKVSRQAVRGILARGIVTARPRPGIPTLPGSAGLGALLRLEPDRRSRARPPHFRRIGPRRVQSPTR
jgi:hypothetical protein